MQYVPKLSYLDFRSSDYCLSIPTQVGCSNCMVLPVFLRHGLDVGFFLDAFLPF